MPRKQRNPKTRRAAVIPVHVIAWLISDGTAGPTGHDVAPDRATARQVWPHYRRAVWAATHRGQVPAAAEAHDGLTRTGFRLLWDTWRRPSLDLAAVLAAVATDRAAVAAFMAGDPGAAEISDYLADFAAGLDRVEAEARRYAAAPLAARLEMGAPRVSLSGRYGDMPTGAGTVH